MSKSAAERDWKCMKKHKEELLSDLCKRINSGSARILQDSNTSEHQKYQKLYEHIHDSDEIVAECFDDWSRSKLFFRLLALQRHNLLNNEIIKQLSDETQERLKVI